MRQKLTVLIPCKNERKNIRPCVESIRKTADEILIADSGSTDGTLEIVQKLGNCRVIQRDYVNSADFKNWAIPQASHSWVLILDADERIPAALAAEIEQVLRKPPEDLDAYSCAFQDFFFGHPLRYSKWDSRSIRLIRRDVCRYQARRVHADIAIDRARVGELRTEIPHYSVWDYDSLITKYARYTTWASQDMWERGRRATFFSLTVRPFLRFLYLYLVRRGFLDGIAGLQVCIFFSFFSTYLKQAKLWQRQYGIVQPDPELELESPAILSFPASAASAAKSEVDAAGKERYRRAG